MATLELVGVAKRFGAQAVLHPTSLSIADGSFTVIVGPSGCGKSTLLRLIAGLEEPDAGRIAIGGRDMAGVAPAGRGVAMVFQSYALYPHLTVAGNIGFPLAIARVDKAEVRRRVARVAEMLGLTDLLDRRPRALSGGQRQRVAIGRAIVRDPAVLLLDEPLSNLDAELRVRMRRQFARLHQELGATMVYVTHDQVEAMTLAERIVVMSAGRVEQEGTPMALYARPATLAVAAAIGSPAMNLLAVTIVAVGDEGATVALANGARIVVGARVPAAAVGSNATLGIRPEHLRLADDGPFAGTVALFERLGPLSFAHLAGARDADVLVAQLAGDSPVTLGDMVRFAVDPSDAQLFAGDGRAWPRCADLSP